MFEENNHIFLIVRYSDFILDFLLILRVLRLFKIIGSVKRYIIFDSIMMAYKCICRTPYCKLTGSIVDLLWIIFFKNIDQFL